MPDYTIYVLDEGDTTITGTTGGNGLDGLNQGSGVHLDTATITFNTSNWTGINVTDDDDNFQDSDGSQRLNGAQEIDGTTYADNTAVEAEYRFDVTDGTNTWQLIAFNVSNSAPVYGTAEGIAVIGGPGGFPPTGVPLSVSDTFEGPNFVATNYATPICFAGDTRIKTETGVRAIETVQAGDRVWTHEGVLQTVRWVGRRRVAAQGKFAPVRIEAGALGDHGMVEVSQQHRVLVTGWRAELYFGEVEVLVPAVALINDHDILLRRGGLVTYVHLLFDRHELIVAEGLVSESLHPGHVALGSLHHAARAEVLALMPDLATQERALCRPTLRSSDARVLSA